MNLLFHLFSILALTSGLMVIQARNPVHSVLFLILVFFNAAGILLLLGLDFFAMIFLVVYIGAIAVLFLFVVMMLNIKLAEINENKLRYLPIGGLLAVVFLFEIFLIIDNDLIPLLASTDAQAPGAASLPGLPGSLTYNSWLSGNFGTLTNIESIGELIYTYYFFFMLIASLILLVAMIGAIVLTMHKGGHIQRQEVIEQNMREFAKTVKKQTLI